MSGNGTRRERAPAIQGRNGNSEGFVYGGKIYIVASQVNTARDAIRVLFHEALGYYGLRGVYKASLERNAANRGIAAQGCGGQGLTLRLRHEGGKGAAEGGRGSAG